MEIYHDAIMQVGLNITLHNCGAMKVHCSHCNALMLFIEYQTGGTVSLPPIEICCIAGPTELPQIPEVEKVIHYFWIIHRYRNISVDTFVNSTAQ